MKIHVLEGHGRGGYRVALHTPMPVGNNSVGVAWKAAYLAAGLATTILPAGPGPGQVEAAERTSILAGDTIEVVGVIEADTGGTTPAAVSQMADQIIADALAVLQVRLKYYGYTQVS